MRALEALAAVGLVLGGCGGAMEREETVPLDRLPAAVLEAARKELPGFTPTVAYKVKFEGKDAFEVRARNKRGKIREVEVSPEGKVLEVE